MAKEAVATATGATEEQGPGQQAFNQYCASCHGTDAKGNGPVAATLKKEPADLTQISKKSGGKFDAGDVARMIDGQRDVAGHGPREMPVWGVEFAKEAGAIPVRLKARYAEASILQLVRYIESLQE
jgi:mono/diheme cytochrome c family protein